MVGFLENRGSTQISASIQKREIINSFLLIMVIVTGSWALWYYFELNVDAIKGLFVLATGGAIGTILGFLSDQTKKAFLSTLRKILLSAKLTKILLIVFSISIIFGSLVTRTSVNWKNELRSMTYDDRSISLDAGAVTQNFWSFPYTRHKLLVGERQIEYLAIPFVPQRIELLESDIYSAEPEYVKLSDLLRLAFYQYIENRFLSEAQEVFKSEPGKKYLALNEVYNTLKLCFVETDSARSGDLILERFSERNPKSSWVGLLKSCLLYNRHEYVNATKPLEEPKDYFSDQAKATYRFFRGVNRLKDIVKSIGPGTVISADLLSPATKDFSESEDILRGLPDTYFKQIALPSAQILQGIASFYSQDMEKANANFTRASSAPYPGLKARALNGLGYIKLIQGDLATGKDLFSQSLSTDGSFPYAKTNLAYCYMAEGKYELALKSFEQISQDANLQQESMRDILLARVGATHIRASGREDKDVVEEYVSVLKYLRLFDFSNVDSPRLRLALIYRSIAEKLYGDNRYYGLEMFSFAMYALAYEQLNKLEPTENNKNTDKIKQEIFASALNVRRTLQPTWFIFQSAKGFFEPAYKLNIQLNTLTK